MGIYIPLSLKSQAETRSLTISANNCTSPATGEANIVPSQEVADKLAGHLVENKLAACVNIIPGLTSVYSWKGKIEVSSKIVY